MENKNRAHILLLPCPGQGHINPMLQFAKRLAFKGLKVTLATILYVDHFSETEVGPVAIKQIGDLRQENMFGGSKAEIDRHRLEVITSQALTELIMKHQGSGDAFNCLIYDSFLPYALDVAKKYGLLAVTFFTQPCAVNAIYYQAWKGNLAVTSATSSISLPGLPTFQLPELPSYVSIPESYPVIMESVLNQFPNLEKADYVLVNSFDKLECEVLHWMGELWPIKMIGPAIPSMYLDKLVEDDTGHGLNLWNPNGDTCMKWLDSKPIGSVVYVSFGSRATVEEEQMEELALGLMGSDHYFLWVVRALEEEKIPSNFLEETTEKGLVVNWCPQLDVLAHEAVRCFVTHCGWNSTLEALSLGVPMVAMPQWADQPTNAKYVEEVWGVGVRAKGDEEGVVRKEEVELHIREVMEGEKGKEFKGNASRWRELAKEALKDGGSSTKNIEEFVAVFLNK